MTVEQEAATRLIARLRDAIGIDAITCDGDIVESAAWDALGGQRGFVASAAAIPIAVVYPSTREDVAAIVRVASDTGTPIVPYAAGTGLMGGASSMRPGIVVDMKRMGRLREIDAASRMAWVEAGAVLSDVDDALRPHGLMIGHDPWTYRIATVGGAISTNGLGFLGGKYGSMGDQVLGIEAVMPDSSVMETRAVRPKSAGFDLTRLFIAGEGQFGIITAAALRVFPIPESRRRTGFTFATFERGFEAILAMHALGIAPALLDYGERPPVPDGIGWRGMNHADPPTLFLGFDGLREEVDALLSRASAVCEQHGGTVIESVLVDEFWESRHVIAENFARNRAQRREPPERGAEGRCFDYIHVSLRPSRVLTFRAQALALARRHDVHVLESGIWVTPGLFSLAMANRGEDAVARMSAFVDACVTEAHSAGGSMEYCHGVGIRLAHLMRKEHGAGLDVMRALKRAIDPRDVLNPGKLSLESGTASAETASS